MGLRAAWGAFADRGLKLGQAAAGFKDSHHRQERAFPPSYVSMQGSRARSSKNQVNSTSSVVAGACQLRDRRLELEQDVAQLKKRLVKEENVHRALERAFHRPIGALPRLPQYLPPKTRKLLAEVAVLEEEVVHLEDHVLSMQQDLNDEIIYSSVFSQEQRDEAAANLKLHGKSFFAVGDKRAACGKKDVLIAQLLINEENGPHKKKGLQVQKASVANEQAEAATKAHGMRSGTSRSIPETQKSQLLNSSGATFEKRGVRQKYFGCTNVLSAIQEEEREKENLQLLNKSKPDEAWPSAGQISSQEPPIKEVIPALKKVDSHPPPKPGKSSKLGPNKLSEEMVRCLMGIYGMMTRLYSLSDSDASSVISRSTLSSFSSQSNVSKSCCSSTKAGSEFYCDLERRDPYGVSPTSTRDIGPYRHFQNIGADSFDYSRIPNSASLFRRFRVLIGKLATVELQNMSQHQKLAFWINIYNACMMHAFLEFGIPCGPHQVVGLMRKATLNVGGHSLNALAIEHFILRLPSHSKQAFVKITSKDKEHIQSTLGLDWPEPLVSFALCCGSKSSPAIRVFSASQIENELEVAKRDYLQAAVGINSKGKVVIPKLLEWNMRDFAKDRESLLEWICDQLPCQLQAGIQECIQRANGAVSSVLQVMPYDFNFRYLLTA